MAAFYYRTLLVYLVVHAYLFFHVWLLFDKKRAVLLALPLFAGMGAFPVIHLLLPDGGFLQTALSAVAQFWLPVAFFSLLVFVVYDFFRAASLYQVLLLPGRRFRVPGYKQIVSFFLLLFAAMFGYGLIEARSLETTHLELYTSKLPQGVDRVRIAFASDLHISPHTGNTMLRRAVDALLAEKPDCILLGGDTLDDSREGTANDLAELARLKAPLGVYVVMGNHDAFGDIHDAEGFLRRSGLTLLVSERVETGPLNIVGMDDPVASEQRPTPLPDALTLLQGADSTRYTILLDHRPTVRPETVGFFDLQLSGHSHGGQIPPIKAYMHAKYGVGEGLSRFAAEGKESFLFLTTGVGFSKLPIRLRTPPEVVIIDIVRQ